MAYIVETKSGRIKCAYKDHVKGVWKRKMVSKETSKREAERIANELEHNSWLQAEGLAVRRGDTPITLTEICDWWLAERCPKASHDREESRINKHIRQHKIGALRLAQVDAAEIRSFLHEMVKADAAPASINKMRSTLHSVFAQAIEAKKWTGPNPVAEVKTRSVPKRAYQLLRADEVPDALEVAGDTWRDLSATAVYLALRKGELFGLRKADVQPGRTRDHHRALAWIGHDEGQEGGGAAHPETALAVPRARDADGARTIPVPHRKG